MALTGQTCSQRRQLSPAHREPSITTLSPSFAIAEQPIDRHKPQVVHLFMSTLLGLIPRLTDTAQGPLDIITDNSSLSSDSFKAFFMAFKSQALTTCKSVTPHALTISSRLMA